MPGLPDGSPANAFAGAFPKSFYPGQAGLILPASFAPSCPILYTGKKHFR